MDEDEVPVYHAFIKNPFNKSCLICGMSKQYYKHTTFETIKKERETEKGKE